MLLKIIGLLLFIGFIMWLMQIAFHAILKIFTILFVVLSSIQLLIGFIIERISYHLKIRNYLNSIIISFLLILPFSSFFPLYSLFSFSALALSISLILHLVIGMQTSRFKLFEDTISSTPLLQSRKNLFFILSFTSFILLLSSLLTHPIASYFYEQFPETILYEKYIEITYWAASWSTQVISIGLFNAMSETCDEIQQSNIVEIKSSPTICFKFSTFKLSMSCSLYKNSTKVFNVLV